MKPHQTQSFFRQDEQDLPQDLQERSCQSCDKSCQSCQKFSVCSVVIDPTSTQRKHSL